MSKYFERLDPAKALDILPPNTPLRSLQPFFESAVSAAGISNLDICVCVCASLQPFFESTASAEGILNLDICLCVCQQVAASSIVSICMHTCVCVVCVYMLLLVV